jgi:hypothetical protein
MGRPILSLIVAALLPPLSGCLDGTVDRGLFAPTEAETARRVAAAVPMGAAKADAVTAMTTAGWGCAPARDIFDSSVGRRVYADVVHCEAQPAHGGDFHAKHYFADFMFRDGKVALRNVWMVDPGI